MLLLGICSATTQGKNAAHSIAVEQTAIVKKDTRSLDIGFCSVLAEGQHIEAPSGYCFGIGDSSWNEKLTSIRSTSNTCIQVWQAKDINQYEDYCGDDWIQLSDLSENVSRVCCVLSDAQMTTKTKAAAEPTADAGTHAPMVVVGCNGDGGSCACGVGGDGTPIKMNHFFGDVNAERLNGCRNTFELTGAMWKSQWNGAGSTTAAESVSFDFEKQTAHYGLEGMFSALCFLLARR